MNLIKKLKMKYLTYILFIFCLFSLENVFGQDYNSYPTFVQNKMDENKINGVNIYTDIVTLFDVELALHSADDITNLTTSLQNDSRIKMFSFENNGLKLLIKSEGNYTIKDVKGHIKLTSASIENFNVNYEIIQ